MVLPWHPPKSSHSQPLYGGLGNQGLSSLPNPPRIWLRFVDYTFVIHKAEHTQQFLTYLNSLDPNIQFTTESLDQQGCLPFLDTLMSQGPDWHPLHHSLQETNTYRPISTLGQSPQHHQQIQHLQHSLTQGPVCLFQPTVIKTRKPTHPNSTLHDAIILTGCSTDSNPNWNSNSVKNNDKTTQTYIGRTTETTTPS